MEKKAEVPSAPTCLEDEHFLFEALKLYLLVTEPYSALQVTSFYTYVRRTEPNFNSEVSVRVISHSLRRQLITPTSTSIILDITKTSSNN